MKSEKTIQSIGFSGLRKQQGVSTIEDQKEGERVSG
jgi:hypothetical protein